MIAAGGGGQPRSTPSPGAPTIGESAAEHTDAAIRTIVRDLEVALNTNDPSLMVEHFAADATHVTANGRVLTGRHELYEECEHALRGELRDMHARYSLTSTMVIGPAVVLAHQRANAIDGAGRPLDLDHSMIALYVLVRRDDRWWIVARHDTLVPRGEDLPIR